MLRKFSWALSILCLISASFLYIAYADSSSVQLSASDRETVFSMKVGDLSQKLNNQPPQDGIDKLKTKSQPNDKSQQGGKDKVKPNDKPQPNNPQQ